MSSKTKRLRIAAGVVAGYLAILSALYVIDGTYAQSYQAINQAIVTEGESITTTPAQLETAKVQTISSLAHEPVGVAGLDPTAPLVLERLKAEGDQRAEEAAAALAAEKAKQQAAQPAAQPTTATFVPSSGGNYSSQVRSWAARNSDIKAWIRVPGTNINYPVAHHPDINYYLERGYDKQYSKMGVIWTNGGTTFGGPSEISNNTVLYGHNWTNVSSNPRVASPNDTMFAQLTGYHHLSTVQRNPYIYYSTADADMTFKIFAVFYTELAFNYISPSGGQYIIDEARQRSRFNFDVDVNSSDKILTLSTCTRAYGQTSNQRFVVMARLLRPGETVSPYTITYNPNHRQPNVWG